MTFLYSNYTSGNSLPCIFSSWHMAWHREYALECTKSHPSICFSPSPPYSKLPILHPTARVNFSKAEPKHVTRSHFIPCEWLFLWLLENQNFYHDLQDLQGLGCLAPPNSFSLFHTMHPAEFSVPATLAGDFLD